MLRDYLYRFYQFRLHKNFSCLSRNSPISSSALISVPAEKWKSEHGIKKEPFSILHPILHHHNTSNGLCKGSSLRMLGTGWERFPRKLSMLNIESVWSLKSEAEQIKASLKVGSYLTTNIVNSYVNASDFGGYVSIKFSNRCWVGKINWWKTHYVDKPKTGRLFLSIKARDTFSFKLKSFTISTIASSSHYYYAVMILSYVQTSFSFHNKYSAERDKIHRYIIKGDFHSLDCFCLISSGERRSRRESRKQLLIVYR